MANIHAHNRIEINKHILVGKPVIRGTRISVALILKFLAQGMNKKEILEEYPQLVQEDVLAAIEYAHDVVENETVHTWQLAHV